jgi:hypothetical protein
MASIVLIGTDEALLEGLAQTLGAAGHRAERTTSLAEATRRAAEEPPLVVVAERKLAVAGGARGAADLRRVQLAPGGAVVLFRSVGDDGRDASSEQDGSGSDATGAAAEAAARQAALPPALQRTTLAELALPLERHRLVALVQRVEERARRAGRGNRGEGIRGETDRGSGLGARD